MEAININTSKYYSLSRTIEVVFVLGYLFDFGIRNGAISDSLWIISVLPFILNTTLVFYLYYIIRGANKVDGNYKKFINTSIKFLLNITFIILIISREVFLK